MICERFSSLRSASLASTSLCPPLAVNEIIAFLFLSYTPLNSLPEPIGLVPVLSVQEDQMDFLIHGPFY